jgi:PPP family 3-phenylpropionic acid transporter
MIPSDTPANYVPELRAALYHFVVFGSLGVSTAYLGIWLSNRGLGPEEIGIINAVPILFIIATNTLIGRIADRASDWRQAIIVISLIAAVVPVGLLFVSGFWGILLVWILCIVPTWAVLPVLDAATLRMTQRRGTEFAYVRVWATIGYVLQLATATLVIAWLGDDAFVPLFLAWAVVRALVSLQLPRFRAPAHLAAAAGTKVSTGRLREVMKPWFLLPIIGLSMVYGTCGVLGSFGGLLWKEQGVDQALIGPLMAVGPAAEAVTIFLWGRLKINISARHLIAFACLMCALRWGVLAISPPEWAIFISQLLHSLTFAIGYLGGIYFIANWTSEDIAAEAQGFAFVLQQGTMMVLIVVFGWLFGALGPRAWLIASALCLLGVVCVWISLRLKPSEGRRAELEAA